MDNWEFDHNGRTYMAMIERDDWHGAPWEECDGHGIALFSPLDKSGIIKATLNDCGYRTATTRQAMGGFARAFGCTLSVSFARGGFSIRFKNPAGLYSDRELEPGGCNGPFAMGRYA